MKILKPGKVEQRKFVCPKCGCEFVAGRGEQDTRYQFHYKCPQEGCGWYVLDTGSEPYEEPTQDKSPERKTPVMDVDIIKAAAFILYFKDCFFKSDDDPCVTFREG